MKTIVIDDEPWMLRHFCDECAGLDKIELVGSYRNPLKALEYVQSNAVDLAFIDMEMPLLNGAETAKRLRELLPAIQIIIVSAYSEGEIEAMHGCSTYGYLCKPYKIEDLRASISKITAGDISKRNRRSDYALHKEQPTSCSRLSVKL